MMEGAAFLSRSLSNSGSFSELGLRLGPNSLSLCRSDGEQTVATVFSAAVLHTLAKPRNKCPFDWEAVSSLAVQTQVLILLKIAVTLFQILQAPAPRLSTHAASVDTPAIITNYLSTASSCTATSLFSRLPIQEEATVKGHPKRKSPLLTTIR